MKKYNTSSINKMIKNFDKELKKILLTDLKIARVAGKAFVKSISKSDNEQLLIA